MVAGVAPYQPVTLTKPIGWKGRLAQAQVSTASCPLLLVFSLTGRTGRGERRQMRFRASHCPPTHSPEGLENYTLLSEELGSDDSVGSFQL